MHGVCRFTVVLALLVPAWLMKAATVTYTLADLGPADYGTQGVVNDRGQVLFSSGGASFLYDGARRPIPNTPGGTFFGAHDLNNLGQVVGGVIGGTGYAIGVYEGGSVQVIEDARNPNGYHINDAGQIAGDFINGSYQSFIYSARSFTTISFLPGDFAMASRGINNAGDVLFVSIGAANHAAVYSHGTLTQVPGSAGLDIQPTAINDAGEVVGSARDSSHPVDTPILLSNGQATFLGMVPGTIVSTATAINNEGTIVGSGRTSTDNLAAVYHPGTGWVDLNSAVTNAAGWSLAFAQSINEAGQIAGVGRRDGVPSAFLLTPVPEPSTLALFGLALLGLAGRLRHQLRMSGKRNTPVEMERISEP